MLKVNRGVWFLAGGALVFGLVSYVTVTDAGLMVGVAVSEDVTAEVPAAELLDGQA